jgi:hypothetical protein
MRWYIFSDYSACANDAPFTDTNPFYFPPPPVLA